MKFKTRIVIYIACLLTITAGPVQAQEKIRTVEKGQQYANAPIEIIDRELTGKRFIDDSRVLGDQDWLKQLTLVVKNVSNKNIMSFNIDLLIKKQGKILMGIPIQFRTYTKPNENNALTPEGEVKLGVLQSGEVVKVKVLDHYLSSFGNALKRYDVEDIDRVTIDIRGVFFDDGTRWMFGQESRPDPNNPGKRIRIDKSELKLSQRFSEWLNYLLPILPIYSNYSNHPFGFIFPAGSRNFFISANAGIASPPPPPTCVWLVEDDVEQDFCDTGTEGCSGNDIFCIKENFASAISASDPGGGALKGFMQSEPYRCQINREAPAPPTCSTCQNFTHDVFRVDTQCGQPGTCGQSAAWGCVSGLEDVGGFCQKSQAFQNACPAPGYDSFACACYPTPTPTPTPSGCGGPDPQTPGECWENGNQGEYCCILAGWEWRDCQCRQPTIDPGPPGSPIVIDIAGNGFDLTDSANGVLFDLNSNGTAEQLSWTSSNSDEAWLVLDRNQNGLIDNGREMFGDYAAQPPSVNPNGFIALAEYDRITKGGNNDGKIDIQDAIFIDLRLWRDTNHNGVSESIELHPLNALGVAQLDLDYKSSRRVDEHGNQFRYRAKVRDEQGNQIGRWAWDVFLVTQQ